MKKEKKWIRVSISLDPESISKIEKLVKELKTENRSRLIRILVDQEYERRNSGNQKNND